MKKIGFLYGKEVNFSVAVMQKIHEKNIPELHTEEVIIGILDTNSKSKYSVILDRFSNSFNFYEFALAYFRQNGVKIVSDLKNPLFGDEFSYQTRLKKLKIHTPKTAIFPSKVLPNGVNGADLRNLEYPLKWDEMFDEIGLPANIKSNHSSEFYDCFRIHNRQDFYFIYDMSGTNTLVLQECIDTQANYRVFVVGDDILFLRYDLHKAPKDRYSIPEVKPSKEIYNEVDKIVELINKHFDTDMYILDIAVADKIYVLNLNSFFMNIDNLMLDEGSYNWLVDKTADLLIHSAGVEVKAAKAHHHADHAAAETKTTATKAKTVTSKKTTKETKTK